MRSICTLVITSALVSALTGACSSTKDPAATPAGKDGGPSAAAVGTVPADLRDVERDGEGLVNTTFGHFPDRKPEWTRATGVLSLLKTVWGRGKSANPGLPAAQSKMLDDAIATLETAIAANDQQKASYASNVVGLAVPEIFDSFHPDAPIGVVRLDAMFRQVGLDGHYKKFDDVKKDIASMKTDWANTKGSVGAKVPTCHRVGGTSTVVADIDASLARLDVAVAASDTTAIEQVSEDGAIEIDTLELLYDCPPDGLTPDHGIGAKCTDSSQCEAGQDCDKLNAGGKCAPNASNKIGTACTGTVDCGSDSRAACNTEAGDNFKGGYCFMEPCDDIHVCPSGATCVSLGGETPGCFKSCLVDKDCRVAEGYVCQLFTTQKPKGFGPSDKACAFPCTRDDDCQKPLTCDAAVGKCKP